MFRNDWPQWEAMTATEIECRLSWTNAALRYLAPVIDELQMQYTGWSRRHGWLCCESGSRGLKVANL